MLLFIFCLFFSVESQAEFNLTSGLNHDDRQLILKTLGLGTASKMVSQPQPLGSDSGLELSLVTETINTSDISSFIIETKNRDSIYYPKLVIGKGIFSRSDIFFHFIPFTKTLGLSEYGGLFRYNFYQSEKSPLLASIVIHGSSSNFNNQLISRNLGANILFGMSWNQWSLSTSIGTAQSSGRFIGGTNGVTSSNVDESESVRSFHYSVGLNWKYSKLNIGAALNHYTQPVYSLKVGILL